MAWDTGLLGVARNIAATNNSPLRVMAGPGTGKSFALKRRVARLLGEGANAERILAVTFTRNAAADLLDDLQALEVDGCERIRVGTLHAFCYSILMKREVLDILNRNPRPILFFNRSGVMQFEGSPLLTDTLGFIKGKSAIRIHRDILNVKKVTGLSFWARGYCVSTVGLDEEMIKNYIKHQDNDN